MTGTKVNIAGRTSVKRPAPSASRINAASENEPKHLSAAPLDSKVSAPVKRLKASRATNKLVALACSTGGPKALQDVIPYLDAGMDAPMVLGQHMPEGCTGTLASRLNDISKVTVKEAADGAVLEKGHVYIAPGGSHMCKCNF